MIPTWVSVIIGIAIIAALVGLFILGYVMNKRTPVPAGCENLTPDCEGCAISSCSLHRPSSDKVEVI